MRLRLVAFVLLVLAVTAGGVVAARTLAERDAQRDAEHRADIAATEVSGGIEQATNLVESLRRLLLGGLGDSVTNAQFIDIGARSLSPVGLPAAAWVEKVPELRATLVTGASPMTDPGIDLSGEAALAAAVADPRTLFRVTATPLAQVRDGRKGLFLVQSAPRLSDDALEPGFVVLFVPASWLLTAATALTGETIGGLELRIGDTSYGDLGNAAAVGSTFSAVGRRFDVLVPQKRVHGAAALLPWLILGGGLVLAVLAATLATIWERRARAQREVDRIFSLSPDMITVAGFDGFLKRVNPAFEALLGYTEHEARARPYLEFVHANDREHSAKEARGVLEADTTRAFANRMVCKDGSSRWIDWTATPVLDEGLLYGIGRDVTERRRTMSEQAALRRVATLAAEGVQPEDLFAVVAEEVARVVDVPLVRIVRYEPDDTATECASFSTEGPKVPFQTRSRLEGMSVLRLVRDSSAAARIDDYSGLEGEIAEIARSWGILSAVGSPIAVAGRLWGAVVASSTQELPEGTEARLADFTELLATAIANAESRVALAELAEEQATLRRMATLVAQGVPPADIFSAVSDEIGRLFGSDGSVVRFDHDDPAIVFVGVSKSIERVLSIGTRWDIEDTMAASKVYRTGGSARSDASDFSSLSRPVAAAERRLGVASTVASPIIVEGRPWGAVTVWSTDEPLPLDTEERLEKFTELVATAIANAESRGALAQLADEQAALQRVATLVAQGVPPAEIFSAVSDEVGRLFGKGAAVLRFDHDGPAAVFVGVANVEIQIGTRLDFQDGMASAEVYRTGRSARVDAIDWSSVSRPVGAAPRRVGDASTVVSPIVVDGRLWGAMSLSSPDVPLPLDAGERLEKFTELVGTAIANAESKSELAASRRRIVAAADEARRRIERDLHDGTQQRLASLSLALRTAGTNVPPDRDDLRSELSHIAADLAEAVADLQELSRGIHPAVLSRGGLGPALRTLGRRSPIPVELDIGSDTRLPEPIEVAAYFVVSEALANATKHAQASRIEVSLASRNGSLLLSIRDDGIGGAESRQGSGLVGLHDRVEALGGTIRIESPPGAGTLVVVALPLEVEPARLGIGGTTE